MIKWLRCLLFGHDIDLNIWRDLKEWEDHIGGTLVYTGRSFWCKRCCKFKKVS